MWRAALLALLGLVQEADYSEKGLKALEERNYPAAVELFQKAVAADPKDYGAQFHLSLALSLSGKLDEAVAGYRRVLELKPGLYEAQLNLGMLQLQARRFEEAAKLLEAAAAQKPKEFRPVFYLGEALLEAGQLARAEAQFKAAIELDGKSAAAQLGMGRALLRQDRVEDAAPYLRKAAGMDAGYKDALLELAAHYERRKRSQEAIAIYEQFPEMAAAQERLGNLLLESGRAGDAVGPLEAAVTRSPTPANRYALAIAYLRTSQPGKAGPMLEQSLAAEPGNTALRMAFGRVLRDQKQYAAAAREFWRVAQAKPDSAEAWNELAGMLILLESFPQALAALDKLKAMGAEMPAHHYFRAIVLDRLKQPKPALESYQKFLAESQGKHPDEEFKARQRVRILQKELSKR